MQELNFWFPLIAVICCFSIDAITASEAEEYSLIAKEIPDTVENLKTEPILNCCCGNVSDSLNLFAVGNRQFLCDQVERHFKK